MNKIFSAILMSLVLILGMVSAVSAVSIPTVGDTSRKNLFGNDMNNYLLVSHTQNGTLKSGVLINGTDLLYEGNIDDSFETNLTVTNPTADRTITLPDASGSVVITNSGVVDISGNRLIIDDPGPTFNGTSSRQTIQADANFNLYTGSSYGAGVMGNAIGTLNSGASNSIIAGLIGKYNINTVGGNTGPKGAVIAEIGEEATGTKANGAFIALLGGSDPDAGTITPGAAYTVRSLNVNSASKFDYGLDLKGVTISGHQPITYGTADIQLANGATIYNNDTSNLIITEGNIIIVGNLNLGSNGLIIAEGALATIGSSLFAHILPMKDSYTFTSTNDGKSCEVQRNHRQTPYSAIRNVSEKEGYDSERIARI